MDMLKTVYPTKTLFCEGGGGYKKLCFAGRIIKYHEIPFIWPVSLISYEMITNDSVYHITV